MTSKSNMLPYKSRKTWQKVGGAVAVRDVAFQPIDGWGFYTVFIGDDERYSEGSKVRFLAPKTAPQEFMITPGNKFFPLRFYNTKEDTIDVALMVHAPRPDSASEIKPAPIAELNSDTEVASADIPIVHPIRHSIPSVDGALPVAHATPLSDPELNPKPNPEIKTNPDPEARDIWIGGSLAYPSDMEQDGNQDSNHPPSPSRCKIPETPSQESNHAATKRFTKSKIDLTLGEPERPLKKVKFALSSIKDGDWTIHVGDKVMAKGFFAIGKGICKTFVAEVLSIRSKAPQVRIKYLKEEGSEWTHPLALPTPKKTFVNLEMLSPCGD